MKKVLKFLSIFLIFLVSLLAFLPKEGFYNLLEKELFKTGIILSSETRDERLLSLELNGIEVYYKGIYSAFVKDVNIFTCLISSKIEINSVSAAKQLRRLIPLKLQTVQLEHSLLSYDLIKIKIQSELGEFLGTYDILKKEIKGELIPLEEKKAEYRNLLRQFKFEKGRYFYEYKL